MKYLYLSALLLVLIPIFQNIENSGLNFYIWSLELPKGVLWIMLIGFGYLIGEFNALRRKKKPKAQDKHYLK
jgi:uncharacterized integral membrane protein